MCRSSSNDKTFFKSSSNWLHTENLMFFEYFVPGQLDFASCSHKICWSCGKFCNQLAIRYVLFGQLKKKCTGIFQHFHIDMSSRIVLLKKWTFQLFQLEKQIFFHYIVDTEWWVVMSSQMFNNQDELTCNDPQPESLLVIYLVMKNPLE